MNCRANPESGRPIISPPQTQLHYLSTLYTPSEPCSGGLDGDSQTTALVRAAHIGHAGVVQSLLRAGVARLIRDLLRNYLYRVFCCAGLLLSRVWGVCVCVHWASDTGLRSHLVSLSHECRVDSVRLQISAGKPESLGDTRVSILLLHLCFCFHGCRFQVVIVIGFQVAVSTKACVFNVVDLGRKINMQYSTS